MKLIPPFASLLLVFLVSGCATSRTARIQEKSVLFQSLAPDDQERVENGEVEIGYSRDMVYMALGKPSSIEADSTGRPAETWIYRNYFPSEPSRRKGSGQKPVAAPPPGMQAGTAAFGGSSVTDSQVRGVLTDLPRGSSGGGGGGSEPQFPPSITLKVFLDSGRVVDLLIVR